LTIACLQNENVPSSRHTKLVQPVTDSDRGVSVGVFSKSRS